MDLTAALKELKPSKIQTLSKWAEQYIKLSSEGSAQAGTLSFCNGFEYQREILDTIGSPAFERLVLMTSSQIGKTHLLLLYIAYLILNEPCPILCIQPTLQMAEVFSKDRLSPMLRDSPLLHGTVKDSRIRDSGNTLLHKKFAGGQIAMSGANSPASLASRPCRVIIADELDRFPPTTEEGCPLALSVKRATSFYNRKIIIASTPTVQGQSKIEREYENSDQRRFFIKCPQCSFSQYLKFPQLKWTNRDPNTVHYECENCTHLIAPSEKKTLVAAGEWVATATSKRIAGFHINELYSPFKTWQELVSEFLVAKEHPDTLRVWVNTSLGESFRQKGESPNWERLYRDNREPYQANTIPDGVLFLTCGIDIQKTFVAYEVVGWCEDKSSYSIDYQEIHADPNTEEAWRELDKLVMKTWQLKNGMTIPIKMIAVDTGYLTQRVYWWARRHGVGRVMAVKGFDHLTTILGMAKLQDLNWQGRSYYNSVKLWPVGVSTMKFELYSWLGLEKPLNKGDPFQPGYCHFPEYGEDYFKMLTAEEYVPNIRTGGGKWERLRRNEALDVRLYARAAANRCGLDVMTKAHWNNLKGQLNLEKPSSNERRTRKSYFNI